ncbi:hypothetical protein ACJRO7_018647 [Eucalyptus globulus]|uniref:RNase H type-1 domain-containing protein n=1 Tax=Eucalyptus globulus TaxID=34317 RepID=A0ABD3KUG5_EUCGL
MSPDPEQLVEIALTNAEIAHSYHRTVSTPGKKLPNPDLVWCPPDPRVLKINIDRAFPTTGNEGAIACVCRDHSRTLVDGFTSNIHASSALQAETQALILTLKHLLQKGKEKEILLLESDCLVLVEAVHNPSLMPWESHALFAECAALFPRFSNLRLQHCRRKDNHIVDWAAKAHGHRILPPNWAVKPPQPLLDLVCSEALAKGCSVLPT